MRHLIAVFAITCVLAVAGCKDSNNQQTSSTSSQTSGSDPKMMSTKDDCTHCAGVQTANADGRCPMCGMKVK